MRQFFAIIILCFLSSQILLAQDNRTRQLDRFAEETSAIISFDQTTGNPGFVRFPADQPLKLSGLLYLINLMIF